MVQGQRQSRNIFLLSSGLYVTIHHSSVLFSYPLTILAKVYNLFLISSHHLGSLPHQVDDPFGIHNSSSPGIFFSWIDHHSISTTQCLVYILDLVPTSDEISYSLHHGLTYLYCHCMKTHSSNSINTPHFKPCLFLFPTPPTLVMKTLPNPQIHLLSACKT